MASTSTEITEPAETTAKPARKGPPKAALIALGLVALLGLGYYLYSSRFEDTDDAQIDGNIANISPRVSGTLKSVNVVDNQIVKTGDLLAEIDPLDYEVAVAQARATVAQAEALLRAEDPSVGIAENSNAASVTSTSSDLTSALAALSGARREQAQVVAQLAQAAANDRNAQLELSRATKLVAKQAISQADFDARTNAAAATAANVEALRQAQAAAEDRVRQAEARISAARSRVTEAEKNAPRTLETRRASVVARQAGLSLAQAQLRQAELNLAYTRITAPSDGVIGKKSVSSGDRVSPGQVLMALSEIGNVWVTANFRETQLRHMRPGLRVSVHVDALDADLHGTVTSIGGATGSRYSVLPPENATGNYVKVVQRIPVRIDLDAGDATAQALRARLRPGMSAEPQVKL